MLFPTNWNVLIGFTDRYFLLWLEPFLYVTTGHCLQVFKLETNTPTLMNELLVSRPTRWYLSFWYLDFYLNHLFPKPDNREILAVQRCGRARHTTKTFTHVHQGDMIEALPGLGWGDYGWLLHNIEGVWTRSCPRQASRTVRRSSMYENPAADISWNIKISIWLINLIELELNWIR